MKTHTRTVLKRCISGMPSYICPLIRPRYLQRSRRSLMAPIDGDYYKYTNETDEHDEHTRFEDMIIMDQKIPVKETNVKETKTSCSNSRKLAEEFIQEKMVSSIAQSNHFIIKNACREFWSRTILNLLHHR